MLNETNGQTKTFEKDSHKILIRKTTSACPTCRQKVKAEVVEEDGRILLKKHCSEHGTYNHPISNHPWYYTSLDNYFQDVMPKHMKQNRFYIYLSNKCNLQCPICLLEPNTGKVKDVSLDKFKEIIKDKKEMEFYLFGAEATIRTDIEDWLKLLSRYNNNVNMHSNGIKLTDLDFLKKLKDAGLGNVSLQFDAFNDETYRVLRRRSLLDIKLRALENLKKCEIPTALNVTIARGVNEDQIKPIMDYALKNPFVNNITFTAVSLVGDAEKNFKPEDIIMSDELIDIVERETKGKIDRKSMHLFQKLYYATLSSLKIRNCNYFEHMAVFREGHDYCNLSEILELDRFEKRLDKYRDLVKEKKGYASAYFFFHLVMNLLGRNAFKKLKTVPFNMLLPGRFKNHKIPSKILVLSLGVICDWYNWNKNVSDYCTAGVCVNKGNGELAFVDSIPSAVMFEGK